MTEQERGSDRLGRRAKRFLTPLQKYEIWLQLVRGETTISEAADRYGVDRSTIMRLRMVAKDGAIAALAESKPGVQQAKRDLELEAARAEAARLGEALKELAVRLVLVEGKERWGRVAGSRRGWARPPSPGCWTCSATPPRPAGRCGPPARCWRSASCASTGGWAGELPANSRTRRRVAARCTACWTGRSPRSCGCSRSGV